VPSPKILLLIDDAAFRTRLIPALRTQGLGTILTGDGAQARDLVRSDAPALIVVDSKIPDPGGLEWVRSARAEGLVTPMILAASSKEEMQSFLTEADGLRLASVVTRSVPADAFAKHVVDVLAESGAIAAAPAPAEAAAVAASGAAAGELAAALEKVRVSLVRLEQNPVARDRIAAAQASATAMSALAAPFRVDAAVAAAKRILAMMKDALDGRLRLDTAEFRELERLLGKARAAAPSAVAVAPPAPVRRPTASSQATLDVDATGLLARDAFLREANELFSAASISGQPLTFAVLHIAGADALEAAGTLDRIVRETGKFLVSRFRPTDRRGQWSPSAFALAIPGTPAKPATDLLVRTIDAWNALRLGTVLGAGVTTWPKSAKELPMLLALAERLARETALAGGGVRSA
jgi:CheY-like chemotaxis protein/GGDEF domain-containing protein